MSIREKIYELKTFNQILHTTFNPYEPGVARIYLIPPKLSLWKSVSSVVIVNGHDILQKSVKYCNENLIEISFTSPGWIKNEKIEELGVDIPSCGACLSNMAITPNGDVVPCQSWLSENGKLGNILKDSWKNIWESKKCKKIRNTNSKNVGKCLLKGDK